MIVRPEFDPVTKTWFLPDHPEIEAPTLRGLKSKLPCGYQFDPTYRLDGAPIVVRQPQERSTDAVQKYLSGFAAPKPTAERKPPTPPAPAPAPKVAKRKPMQEISAAARALAEHVAELYAATIPIKDIATAVGRSQRRVLKIIDSGRAMGDPRFDVPRLRARPNTRQVYVVGRVTADGGLEVLSAVTEADAVAAP